MPGARAPNCSSDADQEGQPGAVPPTASRWQTCPSQELELELRGKPTKRTRDLLGLGALLIPLALGESEAAAAQLCSLGCVSGGTRDLKRAHSFCESPGPPAETAVKCGKGPPKHRLDIWGTLWERSGR